MPRRWTLYPENPAALTFRLHVAACLFECAAHATVAQVFGAGEGDAHEAGAGELEALGDGLGDAPGEGHCVVIDLKTASTVWFPRITSVHGFVVPRQPSPQYENSESTKAPALKVTLVPGA